MVLDILMLKCDSGYVETQGAFTRRYAREMRKRLNLPCTVHLIKQTDFNEPMKRINSQLLDKKELNWSEKKHGTTSLLIIVENAKGLLRPINNCSNTS